MGSSDPHSPRFGKHYTEDEIIDIFAPARDAVEATTSWLQSAGISPDRISESVNNQWIQFDAAVEEV